MVYKGCERKMIMIKNPKNSYFDEVYFILKEKTGNRCENENDMLKEANRIVNENIIRSVKRQNEHKKGMIYFSFGVLSGIVSSLMMYMFFNI